VAERRRLGRGLDALIPAEDMQTGPSGEVREIELSKIELNPKQPRFDMDEEKLGHLADSVRSSGVIQPVLVRPAGELFELVCGERRLRAARMAGLGTVPAIVRDVPDEKMLELALIENIQRHDLNPIEQALGVRRMISELDLTQEEAGRRLGLNRSTVANTLRLLNLPEELQAMVSRGTLTAGHARALLSVENNARRTRLANLVVQKGMSVREAERLAAGHSDGHKTTKITRPSPNVVQLEERLSEALGTKVEIKPRKKGGKIVLHFNDNDDFERLFEQLSGESSLDYPRKVPA